MNSSLSSKLPTIESTEIIAEHKHCQIQIDHLRLPSGKKYDYTSFASHDQAVMVLAETSEGKYVMNEEYRCPTRKVLLSLPGGCVDKGEKPEDAASRELFEETGYKSSEYIFLGQAHPSPGNHCQETFYYYAKNALKASDPTPDFCEIFETVEMTLEEINERLLQNKNLDGHVSIALYLKMLRKL